VVSVVIHGEKTRKRLETQREWCSRRVTNGGQSLVCPWTVPPLLP
jgi:hypothetical protein